MASHFMGFDLTYSCIGPNTYQITLKAYRDCNGIELTSSFNIDYRSLSCGVNASLNLNRVSVTDITPLCPSQTSACSGGNSPLGVELHVYQGILTLPSGCNDWVLSTSSCCRNNAITNLTNPGSNEIYIEAQLNNTVTPCNSSPIFASEPTPFTCVNQTVRYQQLATDPDGDSLVYSLTNCRTAQGTNVTYAGGFNATNPLTVPVTIDPVTGEMTFTANTPQTAVICVRVEEYRNGVKIGEIVRDLQFVIQNCNNQLPVASGINGSTSIFDTVVCIGTTICFDINATDANAGNNITMTIVRPPVGSTFNVTGSGNNRTGTFCWNPTVNDIGTHFFSINLRDDACPIPGQNSRIYRINILANPNPPVNAGNDVTICAGQSTVLNATTTATNIDFYQWTPANGLSSTSNSSTTATPASTTNYTVQLHHTDGCVSTDNVLVTIADDPVASISPSSGNVCAGGNFLLTGTTNTTGFTFEWFDPSMNSLGAGTVTGTFSTLNVSLPGAVGNYIYTLRVTNPVSGCSSEATTTLTVGSPPPLPTCINIYVTTSASSTGAGTQADPTSLLTALSRAACQNAVIKLGLGTYNIDNPINLSSFVTLEGGYIQGPTWFKSSQPGGTVINRTNLNPEGVAGAQRLVAFYGNSISDFRLQDITITTANANQVGMSTYGLHLTNCSNYRIVRTQVLPGNAAAGANGLTGGAGASGANGANGGAGSCNGNCVAPNPFCTESSSGGIGGAGGNGAVGTAGGAANAGTTAINAGANGTGRNGGGGGAGGKGGGFSGGNSAVAGSSGGGSASAPVNATGGAFGNEGDPGGNGANGGNGIAGNTGSAGTSGSAGSYVGGFWVPGGQGSAGTDGTGGSGGAGGGGSGRQTCTFCDDGPGNGGGGGGGGGQGGAGGLGGFGGGSSVGIYLFNNGTGGNIVQSRIVAGAAGPGGNGGAGGAGGTGGTGGIGSGTCSGEIGRGGNGGRGGDGGTGGVGGFGVAGLSDNVRIDGGSALLNNDNAFNLAGQPEIRVQNVNCVFTPLSFDDITVSGAIWDFDILTNNASPPTSNLGFPSVAYTAIDRYSVSLGTNVYSEFHNIQFLGSTVPQIATNANQIGNDTFQLCAGEFASFESQAIGDTYVWNFNGAIPNPGNVRITPSQAFNNPGFYTVTLGMITDCCGQSPLDTIYLYVDPVPNITGSGNTSICQGQSAVLSLSGVSASDSVVWSPTSGIISTGSNSITVSPNSTTNYIASVYSEINRAGQTALSCPVSVNFNVNVGAAPDINFTPSGPSCNNNGQIVATASGVAGNFDFTWSTGFSTTNTTTSTLTGIPTGLYFVTATHTTSGCTVRDSSFLFPGPGAPVLFLQSSTPAACTGNIGTATLNTSGGSAPFSYLWDNGATTASLSGLAAGNYCATVTDNNGCSSNICFDVTAPNNLVVDTVRTARPGCTPVGLIEVEGTGGSGVITYLWGNGVTTTTLSNLPSGIYNVTATDALGCTAVGVINLTSPISAPLLSPQINTPIACNGQTATISAGLNGGTAPFTYNWTGGSSSGFPTNQDTVSGAGVGIYNVTVTDAGGCSVSAAITVTEPAVLGSSTLQFNVDCNGNNSGSVTQSIIGGVSPFSVLWSNGRTTQDLVNVGAGIYTVTITDNNNCTATNAVTITEPTALTGSFVQTNVDCNGDANGAINITVNGGTPIYNFNWNNGAVTEDLNGLSGGNYQVTITDINGCTLTQGTVTITEPTALTITDLTTAARCGNNSGTISLTVTGGTAGYSYQWSNGASTEDLSGLVAGDYDVIITDSNGCSTVRNNINVAGGSMISVTLNSNDEECGQSGTGSINLSINGGLTPYQYSWNNGETTQNLNNLNAGNYNVTVTDNDGCSMTLSSNINSALQPTTNAVAFPSLSIDTTINWGDEVNLDAGNDQSNLGVTYNWSVFGSGNPVLSNPTDNNTNFNTDIIGSYTVILTATSADGCISVDTILITVEANEPQFPTAFSPNGDGNNDVFQVYNLDKAYITSFTIYNRWGKKVYENFVEAAWNGKYENVDQPREVYMYVISYKSPNGSADIVKRGHITLLR